MLNDQQRSSNQEVQPTNVVVTTETPVTRMEPVVPLGGSTRVEVNQGNTPVDRLMPIAPLRSNGEVARQKRYNVGKIIDYCWYVLGLLEIILAVRFFFALTAANSAAGFVKFIFGISGPFAWGFNNIFPVPHDGNNVFDTNIIVAMVVYVGVAWGITRLLAMTIERPSVQ
jgi:hypothetical protein